MKMQLSNPVEILEWYRTAGVDEAVADAPVDRFKASEASALPPSEPVSAARPAVLYQKAIPEPPRPVSVNAGTAELAQKAVTLEELRQTMENFDGCSLKATAAHMVFGTGRAETPEVMIVGEAPGSEEDRQGVPFVGVSGQLLDKMLASVGLDRTTVYISNVLPWRPPANRKPSEEEVALFVPFIRRHIALVRPKVLLMLGGSAVSALTGSTQGITRARGKWMLYDRDGTEIPAIASFHPAFLLRTPAQKKAAWRDFLAVRQKLNELK